MAVALLQSTTGSSSSASTTLACTLGAAPTSGNLLVFAMGGDKNTGALTLSGFTLGYSLLQAATSLYYWYKISAGTETTINPSWASSSAAGNMAWYGEYEDTAVGGSDWQIAGQASNISNNSTVTTWATGTTGTLAAASRAIAVATVDSSQSVTSVSAWGNSYTTLYSGTGGAGRGGVFLAELAVSGGGTTSSTFNYTGTADQCSGAVIAFYKQAAASNGRPHQRRRKTHQAVSRAAVV